MCGILGVISNQEKIDFETFRYSLASINHRGPDYNSCVFLNEDRIALGHNRLSFIDLTEVSNQPMHSNSKNQWITFNGEIYNYLELKNELKNRYEFKTSSDTEVILASYFVWGIDFIHKLKGMFSFTIIDFEKECAFLVRDRFGIKPLYYALEKGKLIFSSEIKAILGIKKEEKEIDFSSFSDYFVYRFIPSPKTIWKNIQKIPPAHFLKVDLKSLKHEITEYWKLKSINNSDSQKSVNRKVQDLLLNSVHQHSRADVEIGSFLSGGYDSSALVLFMKKLKLNPQTFSIGFSNWDKSEDQFASIVAKHLNVTNKSIITDDKSLELIKIMPTVYDEPIADISIIPTYLVSNLAKSKVKAVMSGEGADEIFGGYTWQLDYWKKSYPKNKFEKLMKILNPIDTVAFYANAMSMGLFDKKELVKMLHPRLHKYISKDVNWFYRLHLKKEFSPLKRIQYLDIKSFMGELVLTKVDRASMANSLEVRVPFLDHELVEYIFSLEEKVYFNPNQTKKLLFEQIKNDLPQQILSRKKQGFVGPDIYYMDIEWYKTELKNSNLVKCEIIQQDYLDSLLKETYNWKLWKILVMEKWYSKWIIK